ncbi:replication-relaxation family protein [Streptacidiphilus sp. EB103A]|uniref:replication-relaxation family protein n=1 Tax=Streptacidiphilus sp. EB103A TaxID=3156275 RepID=UPI003510EDE9
MTEAGTTAPVYAHLRGTTLTQRILAALLQHRMATTGQLHQLLLPGGSVVELRRRADTMRAQHLVDCTDTRRRPAWFLTRDGLDLARSLPDLPACDSREPITELADATRQQEHVLDVLRTGLPFIEHRRSDFPGQLLAWDPQVAHSYRESGTGEERMLVPDARLRRAVRSGHGLHFVDAFVEIVPPATTVRELASRVEAYARFHGGPPAGGRAARVTTQDWRRWYPRFPHLLLVTHRPCVRLLAGLRAMVESDQRLSALVGQVPVGCASLPDLEAHGAGATVWTALGQDDRRRVWTALRPQADPAPKLRPLGLLFDGLPLGR